MVDGYSTSASTSTKDNHFREILKVHTRIVKAITKRYSWVHPDYHYIDLNAGPGIDEKGRIGSPIEFICQADNQRLNYKSYLLEINPKAASRLKALTDSNCNIIVGDHKDTLPDLLPRIPKNAYGLIYTDPTGKIPPFELLGKFSRHSRLIDQLIYVSSANIKRQYFAEGCMGIKRLSEYLRMINKRFWIVREPQNKHQWTFLIGSNWDSFPVFELLGFHKTDSKIGREIMHRLDTTNKERKNVKPGSL
jgi:hypothetical protein